MRSAVLIEISSGPGAKAQRTDNEGGLFTLCLFTKVHLLSFVTLCWWERKGDRGEGG